MTASIITDRPSIARASGRNAGFGALVRKDITEWLRGRRAGVVLAVSTLFMVLAAANSWITARIIEAVPPGVDAPATPASLVPFDNLLQAFGSQIFVMAAIFAVASLLVHERESGTLAWVASKPVSRDAIWLAKFASASLVLAVTSVLVPLAVTTVAVVALYGVPPIGAVVLIAFGGVAAVAFFAALGLAASTVVPGQPAVAAVGFGAFILVPLVGGIVPALGAVLPTSIVAWAVGAGMGADVGFVTPIAWAIGTAGLAVVSIRRMRRIEL
jgi:ABC-2 type transport system permease protein